MFPPFNPYFKKRFQQALWVAACEMTGVGCECQAKRNLKQRKQPWGGHSSHISCWVMKPTNLRWKAREA
eukprot:scaffold45607_cov237-Amphora_coffeaeformis.AAC.15